MFHQFAIIILLFCSLDALASVADHKADLNGDVVVDGRDVSQMTNCLGQDPIANTACKSADVDADGDVDSVDSSFVNMQLGRAFPWRLFPLPKFPASGHSVTQGDLNSDGVPDLAFLQSSGDVFVMFANSDGSYERQQRYAVGDTPVRVAIADLNDDGHADLAVTNRVDRDVSILLGNGNGNFQAQRRFAVGYNPHGIVARDINGDKVPDLLIANNGLNSVRGSRNVSVLLGLGDGSFRRQQRFAADHSGSLQLGDVNGDAIQDIVVVRDVHISVLLGKGDGNFHQQQRFGKSRYRLSSLFALGDLNGDGVLDLALSTHKPGHDNADISVSLGEGDGRFGKVEQANAGPVYGSINAVALGDLDGDNVLDLSFGLDSIVQVWLGNGDGSFRYQQEISTSNYVDAVILGDVNGDKFLDLTVHCADGVWTLPNDGNGLLQNQPRLAGGDFPVSIALGDINGDSLLDLAVANYTSHDVSSLLGNGDGSFQPQSRFAVGSSAASSPSALVLGDINNDNTLDLAVANSSDDEIAVLLGSGNGSLQTQQLFSVGDLPRSLALDDINADGRLDIAAANFSDKDVSVLIGNGNGSFQAQRRFAIGSDAHDLALGDVTGNGVLDLVVAHGNLSLLRGFGNGNFQPAQPLTLSSAGRSVALGDLNGDGATDIVTGGSSGVAVLIGRGNGSFDPEQRYAAEVSSTVTLADANGDGVVDIITSGSDDISVLLGKGDGSFHAEQGFYVGGDTHSIALGDVNGDGVQDLLATVYPAYEVSVVLGISR